MIITVKIVPVLVHVPQYKIFLKGNWRESKLGNLRETSPKHESGHTVCEDTPQQKQGAYSAHRRCIRTDVHVQSCVRMLSNCISPLFKLFSSASKKNITRNFILRLISYILSQILQLITHTWKSIEKIVDKRYRQLLEIYMCLTSLTLAKPKEKMEFPT